MKKQILAAVLVAITVSLAAVVPAFADEEMLVDEEVAIEMGERFFDAVLPDKEIEVGEIVELFNADGETVGFVAHAFEGAKQQGYVVFDKTEELGVAEFAIDQEAPSPYQRAVDNKVTRRSLGYDVLYRTSYTDYAVIDLASGVGFDNVGNPTSSDILKTRMPDEGGRGVWRSSKPSGWDDLMMPLATVYRDYKVVSVNAVGGATAISEATVEAETGRYCCAVSAMLTLCSYYVNTGGLADLENDYNRLWELSETTVDHVGSNGISYGNTKYGNVGPAVRTYCSENGRNLSVTENRIDNWVYYKNAIDSGNMALTRGTCNGGGHMMAVAGYMQLTDKNSPSKHLDTLMVYDGWGTAQRVLNYGSSYYEAKAGLTFS